MCLEVSFSSLSSFLSPFLPPFLSLSFLPFSLPPFPSSSPFSFPPSRLPSLPPPLHFHPTLLPSFLPFFLHLLMHIVVCSMLLCRWKTCIFPSGARGGLKPRRNSSSVLCGALYSINLKRMEWGSEWQNPNGVKNSSSLHEENVLFLKK